MIVIPNFCHSHPKHPGGILQHFCHSRINCHSRESFKIPACRDGNPEMKLNIFSSPLLCIAAFHCGGREIFSPLRLRLFASLREILKTDTPYADKKS
jgi:hypothetical protein